MRLSRRAAGIAESQTLAVTAKAKKMKAEGVDVISFGAGEPDFDTPGFIGDAAKAAIDAGQTRYTPASGAADLKAAVREKLIRDNNLTYEPGQILITCGGKHALYEAFQVLVDEGDEVIIPAPYWVSYPEQAKLAGGVSVIVETDAAAGFKMTPAQLDAAITNKTRVVILNSPSNPTGMAYTIDELKAFAELLAAKDVLVFSDEIYEFLMYDGAKTASMAGLAEGLMDKTFTFNAVSKTFAMTGWRIGYVAGPAEAIKAMGKLQSQSTSNPTSIAQAAAVVALRADPAAVVAPMREAFEKRRDLIVQMLNDIDGVSCPKPQGAFYVFPDVSSHFGRRIGDVTVDGSLAFAQAALATVHVAVVPGVAFGADKHVRLSFACSEKDIAEGVGRLKRMLQ